MKILLLSLVMATAAGAADKVVVPWSFKPLKRPAVPVIDGVMGEVDRFVVERLRLAGGTLAKPADRRTLIRRATLDLHGLLPTEEEVASFLRDARGEDEAFDAVVARLLESPRFGERWGRHWLDGVRYADSTGRSWNAPFIAAAHYRDWVIDAFNADMPYAKFMAAQLAGDLLPAREAGEKRANAAATGMLAMGQSGISRRCSMSSLDWTGLTIRLMSRPECFWASRLPVHDAMTTRKIR
jgi:hypothetical protein